MTDIHILRVFTDSSGSFGDAASVIVDEGKQIPDAKRQELARKLDTGETIFINNVSEASISVMHPQGEIDFAGVGILATSWLLSKLRDQPTTSLQGRGGTIKTWQDGSLTWVRADLATMPPWHHKKLDSPEAVDSLTVEEMKSVEHIMVWAWIDEEKGLIRARTFANDWDIPEAQGNGSGAMVLAAKLQCSIEIRHGEGSVIYAKPESDTAAAIGGRVIEDKKDESEVTQ
jgi:predicted PhzF superfamily epimerase YddE/YHI9